MKIYVIGGKAGSGKSTLGEYLKEELKDYGHKPCIMHITEPLYEYAKNYFDWDNKDEKPREFLQKMGIEIIKEKMEKEHFLLDRLFEDIEILENFFDAFIITDARLVDEFDSIRKKYMDVITIKVERDTDSSKLKDEEKNHITETEIDSINDFDYIVKNKSLKDLKEESIEIIRDQEK